MNIYRINDDNKIFEIITDVIKIEKNEIYTLDGHIMSGILDNAFASENIYKIGDTIPTEEHNEIDAIKSISNDEMINNLTKVLSVLNLENQKKDIMVNTLAKTIAELNLKMSKLGGV